MAESEKPMKWALAVARRVDPICKVRADAPSDLSRVRKEEERIRDATLAIQRAAEPLLAVVNLCYRYQCGDFDKHFDSELDALMPAALEAMEVDGE